MRDSVREALDTPIEALAEFAVSVTPADRYSVEDGDRVVLYFGTFEVEADRYELLAYIGAKAGEGR